jgi:hypothetical protein
LAKHIFLIKIPKTAKGMEKLALSHLAGGNINCYKLFGRNLAKCIENHKKVHIL